MSAPTGSVLDPGVAAYLKLLRDNAQPADDIEILRASAARVRIMAADDGPVGEEIELQSASGPIRGLVHRAPVCAKGVIVYFHGGGWVLLNSETHAPIMRRLAASSGCDVVGVDYPLAPEVRFPENIVATHQAVDFLERHRKDFNLPKGTLFFAGDSSGGNIALAVALLKGAEHWARLGGLMLAYAVLDSDLERPSYHQFSAPPFLLSREKMEFFWSSYCAQDVDRADPLASILNAELVGLPPVYMSVARQDVLYDENMMFAERLRQCGIATTVDIAPLAAHAFWEACALSKISETAIMQAGAWAKKIST